MLNLFQHPSCRLPGFGIGALLAPLLAMAAKIQLAKWMLKQVQHDEYRRVLPCTGSRRYRPARKGRETT
jgi:hypothetical protein